MQCKTGIRHRTVPCLCASYDCEGIIVMSKNTRLLAGYLLLLALLFASFLFSVLSDSHYIKGIFFSVTTIVCLCLGISLIRVLKNKRKRIFFAFYVLLSYVVYVLCFFRSISTAFVMFDILILLCIAIMTISPIIVKEYFYN